MTQPPSMVPRASEIAAGCWSVGESNIISSRSYCPTEFLEAERVYTIFSIADGKVATATVFLSFFIDCAIRFAPGFIHE